MFLFHYKIALIKILPIAKVMENQNFKCINLRTDFMFTNLLKNEAEILLNLVSNDAIKD